MDKLSEIAKKVSLHFPVLFNKVYIGKGQPPSLVISEDETARFIKWRNNVKFILPELYNQQIEAKNYLAAFLLVSNLTEFYLMNKIYELSFATEQESISIKLNSFRELKFFPQFVLNILVWLWLKFSKIYTLDFFISREFTLGQIISYAGKSMINKKTIQLLHEFNQRRKLLIHKLCYAEHADKNLEEESKKACELSNAIWEQLKPDLNF